MASYLAHELVARSGHSTAGFTDPEKAKMLVDPYELTYTCEATERSHRLPLKRVTRYSRAELMNLTIHRRLRGRGHSRRCRPDCGNLQCALCFPSNSVSNLVDAGHAHQRSRASQSTRNRAHHFCRPGSQLRSSRRFDEILSQANGGSTLHCHDAASSQGVHSLPNRRRHHASLRVLASDLR